MQDTVDSVSRQCMRQHADRSTATGGGKVSCDTCTYSLGNFWWVHGPAGANRAYYRIASTKLAPNKHGRYVEYSTRRVWCGMEPRNT